MIQIRGADERGHANHGWLDTRHTFSFADYYDARQMGFRSLRVLNEDRVRPGQGFGTHAHADMEILSYVLEGALEHRDSMGNGSVIRPGEVQRMSAGTGIRHSEANPSATETLHFLQIWILPEKRGLSPGYEQEAFPEPERRGRLRLVVSRDGREGSVRIHQDVELYSTLLAPGQRAVHDFGRGRYGWAQVARGELRANRQLLRGGDGAAISGEERVELEASSESEVLLFDLA